MGAGGIGKCCWAPALYQKIPMCTCEFYVGTSSKSRSLAASWWRAVGARSRPGTMDPWVGGGTTFDLGAFFFAGERLYQGKGCFKEKRIHHLQMGGVPAVFTDHG